MVRIVDADLRERSRFLFDATPWLWLHERKELVKVHKNDAGFNALLYEYGLLEKQDLHGVVTANIERIVAIDGERVRIHRTVYDNEIASYINRGSNRMIKIADEGMPEEVENGTDGVYMATDRFLDVPEFDSAQFLSVSQNCSNDRGKDRRLPAVALF